MVFSNAATRGMCVVPLWDGTMLGWFSTEKKSRLQSSVYIHKSIGDYLFLHFEHDANLTKDGADVKYDFLYCKYIKSNIPYARFKRRWCKKWWFFVHNFRIIRQYFQNMVNSLFAVKWIHTAHYCPWSCGFLLNIIQLKCIFKQHEHTMFHEKSITHYLKRITEYRFILLNAFDTGSLLLLQCKPIEKSVYICE